MLFVPLLRGSCQYSMIPRNGKNIPLLITRVRSNTSYTYDSAYGRIHERCMRHGGGAHHRCTSPVPTEVAVDQIDVVDCPFPPGSPKSKPQKIATLHRGDRVYVRRQDYGKITCIMRSSSQAGS